MKKRRTANSSLELFLDAICNVFGGVLFIALLIAIQVQHTVGLIKPPEAASPEEIAKIQQEFDQISADIAASRVLLETLQATMPRPRDPSELERAELFYKLSAAMGVAVVKEMELLNLRLAMEKEMLDREDSIKTIETTLQQKEKECQKLNQEIELQQDTLRAAGKSSEELQSEIDELNRQVAQKEQNIRDSEANQDRVETIYLPRLHDAGNMRPEYYVLRFNQFYKVSNRSDFIYTGNMLGTPRKDRGIFVNDTDESKQQIRSLFRNHSSRTEFLSIFVYGDSADQWYIIRDLMVSASFKYELIPTADDTPWVFGGSGGSTSVQ